jgi:hypothetical protein
MGGEGPAGPGVLRVRLPEAARVTVARDGMPVHEVHGARVDLGIERPGAYRVEARVRGRMWLISNPVHLRPALE